MLVVVAFGLLGTAAALASPPAAPVRDWLADRIEPAPVDRPRLVPQEQPRPVAPRPSLTLPAEGRLLVLTPLGPWVVQRDGTRRLLGRYDDATWSPRGLHVAVVRGRELLAVVPGTGAVRWTLTRPGRLALPRWAPGDGYRVAYLAQSAAGWRTRVVNGDGSGDRDLAAATADVAPAWRPTTADGYVLAHALAGAAVALTPVDAPGRRVVHRLPARPVALAWSGDGGRLAVVLPGAVEVLDPGGERVDRRALPDGLRARAAQAIPGGQRLLVLADDAAGGSRLLLLDLAAPGPARVLYASPATVGEATPSPDGRVVLATVPGADQWLVLPLAPDRPTGAVDAVAGRFDPDGVGTAAQPQLGGWCCAAGG